MTQKPDGGPAYPCGADLQFPIGWRDRSSSFKGGFIMQQVWADGFNAARAELDAMIAARETGE
jgi:hypothetical protein